MRKLYLKLLRDYLAAKAMFALVPVRLDMANDLVAQGKIKADLAYKMADFMLRARDAKNS